MLAVGDHVMIESPHVGGVDLGWVTEFRRSDVMEAGQVLRQQRTVMLAFDSAVPEMRLEMLLEKVLTLPQARLGGAS